MLLDAACGYSGLYGGDAAGLPSMTRDIDSATVDAAIAWSIRLRFSTAGPEDTAAFEAWRAARPEHDEAWRRLQALDERFDGIAPSIGLKTLGRSQSGKPGRRASLKVLGLIVAGGVGAWFGSKSAPWERAVADHATATGERRTVRLDDGTVLVLNTDTALNVRFSDERRLITLVRGEVCITTGADTAGGHRPFLVQTEFGMLRALGTRFFVRLNDADARLVVEEGAVEISSQGGQRFVGNAGDAYLFDGAGASRIEAAGLDTNGWLDGVVLAHDMPLSQFLAELSRYREGIITCDPDVARLPVSGVYQTGDTDKTLKLVAESLRLALFYRTRYWVTVGAAGSVKKNAL